MKLVNWIDVSIVAAVLAGALLGAQRGILRQVALMAAFYVSLVLAARYYADASGLVVTHLRGADRSVVSAYALAGITAGGTLSLMWLWQTVYRSSYLPRIEVVDHVAGAGLGAAWSWAVVAFAVTVLGYGLSFSWGANDAMRSEIGGEVSHSQIVGAVRETVPQLRELVRPWLPGGLPAPLSA